MSRSVSFIISSLLSLSLVLSGCSAAYVPVSWDYYNEVQKLSRSDVLLAMLYDRFDPDRQTLRGNGTSFQEVLMPAEVKHHLGAYRKDTKLIYRNLYNEYTTAGLRELLVHEFAHHIWFSSLTQAQREQWKEHLVLNPSPVQVMVRRVYGRFDDYVAEEFAFTVGAARPVDIKEFAILGLITNKERDTLLAVQNQSRSSSLPSGCTYAASGSGPAPVAP
ncbi:MAG: hypothetical protein PHI31_05490 [Desulfuromonadaceae bacterium]|nr:hypothetical protein [Desulfuromonadaceae bacterium]